MFFVNDVKTCVIVFTVIVILGLYYKLEISTLELEKTRSELDKTRAALSIAEASARQQSGELHAQIERIKENAEKEILQHNKEIDNLQRVISSSSRLHKCPTTGSQNMPGGSSVTNRENDAGFSAEDARNLAGIAVKGDEAIRRLNACIDAYNSVRDKVNGTPAPEKKK